MPELREKLDMPQRSVCRHVKLLAHDCDKSGRDSLTRKGYGLLKTDQAPAHRYQLAVFLTVEGERLMQKLVGVMGQEAASEKTLGKRAGTAHSYSKQMLS